MTLSIANAQAIQACDVFVDSCDLGTTDPSAVLIIYDGTPPALVDTALGSNTVLSEHVMSNPAFGSAVDSSPGATATANAIADDASAAATGTATFFRIHDRDGTARIQGRVRGLADPDNGEELVINSPAIQMGALVEVSSLAVRMPEG